MLELYLKEKRKGDSLISIRWKNRGIKEKVKAEVKSEISEIV